MFAIIPMASRGNVILCDSVNRLADGIHHPLGTLLFIKALNLYAILKLLVLWPAMRLIGQHYNQHVPTTVKGKLLLAPKIVAVFSIDLFFGLALLLFAVIFLLRPRYFLLIVFCWISFNFYLITLPLANGSDILLYVLAFWSVFMIAYPGFENKILHAGQNVIANLGWLACQMQVVIIYFVSGADKVMSPIWRSGEAIDYVTHFDILFPSYLTFLQGQEWINLVVSWFTITFELGFVVFVWFRKTRILFLVTGILFHLCIAVMLSIPEFSLLMILSYITFLKENEAERLVKKFRLCRFVN
ncbi:MAG: HTTM domain-containing protein [Cyclobacteriaceae bacterium]|nr:HTTM domain-containing protein [Cyclobacteriaceae bacterium]